MEVRTENSAHTLRGSPTAGSTASARLVTAPPAAAAPSDQHRADRRALGPAVADRHLDQARVRDRQPARLPPASAPEPKRARPRPAGVRADHQEPVHPALPQPPRGRASIRRQLNKHESMHTPCTTSSSTATTARPASPPSTAKASARAACTSSPTRSSPGTSSPPTGSSSRWTPKEIRSIRALRQRFSPTLNAHINKLGKFDIDPNRGSLIDDLTNHGDDSSQSRRFY